MDLQAHLVWRLTQHLRSFAALRMTTSCRKNMSAVGSLAALGMCTYTLCMQGLVANTSVYPERSEGSHRLPIFQRAYVIPSAARDLTITNSFYARDLTITISFYTYRGPHNNKFVLLAAKLWPPIQRLRAHSASTTLPSTKYIFISPLFFAWISPR
jgi:hypothetical protein